MNIILGGTSGLGEKITSKLRDLERDTFVVGSSYDETVHGNGMAIDLRDIAEVDKLVSRIYSIGDKALEGFYWVAGYGFNGDFSEQDEVLAMGLVNYAHVIPVAQAAWKKMLKQNDGNFVVVSSTSGVRPRADEAAYVGTKFAQVGFTRSLGKEAERLGTDVKVSLVMPGGMQTPFWDKNPPNNYDEFLDPKKVAEKIVESTISQEVSYYEVTIERGSL